MDAFKKALRRLSTGGSKSSSPEEPQGYSQHGIPITALERCKDAFKNAMQERQKRSSSLDWGLTGTALDPEGPRAASIDMTGAVTPLGKKRDHSAREAQRRASMSNATTQIGG